MSVSFRELHILNVKNVVAISEDGMFRHLGGTVCVLLLNIRLEPFACRLPSAYWRILSVFLLPFKTSDQDTCSTSPRRGINALSYVVAVTYFSCPRLHLS
jgi:hypothetical protein